SAMRRLLCAIAFLTRVPVPLAFDAVDIGRASLAFPLVGAGLGAASFGLALTLARLPAGVVAVLLVAFSALLTGGLHLDGLADSAGGFGGGRSREHALEIMRDHSIGAFGATALGLLLLLKVAALASLGASWRPLLLAPILARWASVPLSAALPNARGSGLGAS